MKMMIYLQMHFFPSKLKKPKKQTNKNKNKTKKLYKKTRFKRYKSISGALCGLVKTSKSKIRDSINDALESQTREAKEMMKRMRERDSNDKAKMVAAELRDTLSNTMKIVHEINDSSKYDKGENVKRSSDKSNLIRLLRDVEMKNKTISER